mgnify:CR=1 FL=1
MGGEITMKKKGLIILLILALGTISLLGLYDQVVKAKEYPSKPITWVVPFGTGGGSDQFARMMEKQMEKVSDAEIVVINIPGAKTAVGINYLQQQPANGYTVFGATTDSVISMVTGSTPFGLKDIKPVAKVQHNVDMLFIGQGEKRFSDFQGMIDYAKQNPGELSIATTGLNGADALNIRAIEEAKNIEFKIVPFSKPGERYAALAGGHVDILYEQPGDVLSFLKADKYKPVISMTEERVTGFKEVPTTVERGIDVTAGYWRSVWVKKETPQKAINYLNDLIKKAVNTEEYKKYERRKYLHLRSKLLTGDDFREFLEKEYEYYNQVMN